MCHCMAKDLRTLTCLHCHSVAEMTVLPWKQLPDLTLLLLHDILAHCTRNMRNGAFVGLESNSSSGYLEAFQKAFPNATNSVTMHLLEDCMTLKWVNRTQLDLAFLERRVLSLYMLSWISLPSNIYHPAWQDAKTIMCSQTTLIMSPHIPLSLFNA